jgi:hydroxyisourate hydrolase
MSSISAFSRRRLWAVIAACVAIGTAFLPIGEGRAQSAPRVNGAINTHVLNAVSDQPATGMTVELFEVQGETVRRLSQATLNAEGRADLMTGRPLPVGRYELRFQLADYFRKQSVAVGDPPFLDYVPIRFSIDTPNGYYHVPLIATPWSYSTYRGS